MSISPLSGQDRLRAAQAAAALRANSPPTGPDASPTARQADTVSISDTGRSLAAAHKAVADVPDVREERVAALKAAIADGTYALDSRSVAANLLKDA